MTRVLEERKLGFELDVLVSLRDGWLLKNF